jgi:hypothetical protein
MTKSRTLTGCDDRRTTGVELHGRGRAQVQELRLHLDRAGPMGDRQIAYYGELRAHEISHDLALERTIYHFQLREQAWYQARMTRARKIADGEAIS